MISMKPVALAVVTVCGLAGFVAPAAAQDPDTTFGAAVGRVNTGDRVAVTLSDGSVVRGRMVELTTGSLHVEIDKPKGGSPLVFQPSEVAKVQRFGDRVWNGLAIGGAIGLALGTDTRYCTPDKKATCRKIGMSLWGSVIAGIGALIDGLIVGRTTVYSRRHDAAGTEIRSGRVFSVAPTLARHAHGLALTVEF